jgi:hypothetical protein
LTYSQGSIIIDLTYLIFIMSKNRGRNRGRGRGRDGRNEFKNDPITGSPTTPKNPDGLVTGTFNELSDTLSGVSWWMGTGVTARAAALEYGYDGGAIEYFAFAPTLLHYQFGTMVQVAYMTPTGVTTSLVLADSTVTFALDQALA